MSRRFFLALLPWLSFAVVDRNGGMGPRWAALAALATVALIPLVSRSRPRLAGLDAVAGVVFAAMAAGYALVPDAARPYSRAIVAAALALALVISQLGRPLTAVYVREALPPACWAAPGTDRLARRLARRWAAVAALASASLSVGVAVGGRDASTVFNWLIPLLAVVVAAVTSPGSSEFPGEQDRQALAVFDGLVGTGPAPSSGPRRRHLRPVTGYDADLPRRAG